MISTLCLTLLLGAPTGETLPEGIEMTCKFDTPTVRLGDLAYCELRVHNRGEDIRKITSPSGAWFLIQPVDELLAANETLEWSIGGGGAFGGGPGTIVLLPGEYAVAWKRVPLFTAESLREMRDRPAPQQLRLLLTSPRVVVRYPIAMLPIRGNIGKHPQQIDLVSKLYVPYKEHPKTPAAWMEMRDTTPSFLNSEGMSQMPRMYETPEGLQWLSTQLDEGSAMYRAVRILQAQQAVTFAPPKDRNKAMERLLVELERCGPAEKEWYIRGQVRSTFSYARDFESQKMFETHYPASLSTCERYTSDGGFESITAEEARFGRRPGISVPE